MSTIDFSIEFFPPRTEEGRKKLDAVHTQLALLNPQFFSVTYGAGGSTRDGTRQLVLDYSKQGSNVAPHLSFGGSEEEEIASLLDRYRDAGINRIVALRGDIPSGLGATKQYRYANELVAFVRERTGDHFHIDVACYPEIHPESKDVNSELDYFRMKQDAGADAAITQYFYNADAYFYFRDRCEQAGIILPIIPGIMPITNYANLSRFSANCGAEIPRWIAKSLDSLKDDNEAIRRFGDEHVSRMCQRLIEGGAPGLHFYSMNQTRAVEDLCRNLGLGQPKTQ